MEKEDLSKVIKELKGDQMMFEFLLWKDEEVLSVTLCGKPPYYLVKHFT